MTVPSFVRWEVHRIATSEHYKSSLIEIQRDWSIDDVCDAHMVLDCFEKQTRLERKRWRK